MIEQQIAQSLDSLRLQSRLSLLFVLAGALIMLGSVVYSVTRLQPLEEEVDKRRQQIARLAAEEQAQRDRIAQLQASYAALKQNAEKLYAVRVTPANQVYEVKATAQATGRALGSGRPEYDFSIFINSTSEVLSSIQRVTYRLDHPTFRQKDYVSADPRSLFTVRYRGWGCLSSVEVTVLLQSGDSHTVDFDMCRSLGPDWSS